MGCTDQLRPVCGKRSRLGCALIRAPPESDLAGLVRGHGRRRDLRDGQRRREADALREAHQVRDRRPADRTPKARARRAVRDPPAAPRATSSGSTASARTRRARSRPCSPVRAARVPRAPRAARDAPRAAGQFTESSGEIKFPEISTPILEKVIQYFYYKLRYTNSQVRIPEFQIDPEMALELLMASNFLDC
jgi:transcription elongation factor B subunit 1